MSDRADFIDGFLQKRYERPAPLRAVPTRNGKPKERAHDATNVPTDSTRSPPRLPNMDDPIHRHSASSRDQLPSANANIIIFILGLFLVIGLYWVMGVYERKILYENHRTRPAF